MYLNQVRRNGMTGLIGYLLLALDYLSIMCATFIGAISAVLSQMPDAGTQPTAEPPAQPAAV